MKNYNNYNSGVITGKQIEKELKQFLVFTKKKKFGAVTSGCVAISKLSKDSYFCNIGMILKKGNK